MWSSATAFNDHGQVVGASNLRRRQSTSVPVGRQPPVGSGHARRLVRYRLVVEQRLGTVVGGSSTADDAEFHAFSWRQEVTRDLGTVGDDTCSLAKFENEHDQVVGTSGECGGEFKSTPSSVRMDNR